MGFLGLRKILTNAFLSRSACVHAHLSHGICRVITPPKCSSTTQRPQHKIATTRSPKWMGFERGRRMWVDNAYGRGIIIGIIDTGITPTHPSFDPKNIPPPPQKWKGKSFINNKIISIKKYPNDDIGVELVGHGTLVASIAAGNFIRDANVSNQLQGSASGIAPHASLAIYQVYDNGHEDPPYRDAIRDAVRDGVHVINVSYRFWYYYALKENPIELGSFDATTKGVLVCCCAGNEGPSQSTVCNSAPWILTVGAANIDRIVKATIRLGNNDLVCGKSINQPTSFPRDSYQIVYAHDEAIADEYFEGKIALYDPKLFDSDEEARERYRMIKGRVVAIIEPNEEESVYTMDDIYRDITTAKVSREDGLRITEYVDSTKHPTASLRFYETDHTPPDVASLSGRGPSRTYKGIIKPDVIAPGVDILGAYMNEEGARYIVDSGTSLACPHVVGVAALIKRRHPEWSPAMIKSAIMTTAYSVKKNGEPIQDERNVKAGLYSMGSGHVNALKAIDPGMVFHVEIDDYVAYLVGLGKYSKRDLMIMLRRETIPKKGMEGTELNLPSFCLQLKPGERKFYQRTGQNVGNPKSIYFVKVNCETNLGVKVEVVPNKIQFSKVNEKITFKVSFELELEKTKSNTRFVEGSIALVSEKHTVTMPFRIEVIWGKKTKAWRWIK